MSKQDVQIEVEIEEEIHDALRKTWYTNKMDWDKFIEQIIKIGLKHHKNGER